MAGKIATRSAYGEALAELGEKYPQIVVLDADLSKSTMTKSFAEKYPERFFDCGIAECNMAGISAGMATCGLKPFINSFAMFTTGRAYEQVRNSIAYPNLNVTIVGSHGGVSVGEDGATHQCLEDYALMRVLPNMVVCSPCDGNEMKLAVEALINHDGPSYLRLSRPNTAVITDEIEGYKFELGKGVTVKDGSDLTIIAAGIIVPDALKAAELLAAEGISARVVDMHTIKPLDEELVVKCAEETGCILTVEEHFAAGGLGGAVCEAVSGKCPVPVVRHGIQDEFGRSAKALEALSYYGLDAEGIAAKAKEALRLKK